MNIAATQATVLSSADPAPQVETPQTIPLWRALITAPAANDNIQFSNCVGR